MKQCKQLEGRLVERTYLPTDPYLWHLFS